jgi:hypothetical protein
LTVRAGASDTGFALRDLAYTGVMDWQNRKLATLDTAAQHEYTVEATL